MSTKTSLRNISKNALKIKILIHVNKIVGKWAVHSKARYGAESNHNKRKKDE